MKTLADKLIPIIFALLLIGCNTHLFTNQFPAAFIYDQQLAADGQWWRILTYPLVHIGWYHVLLDVSAVIILWRELQGIGLFYKLSLWSICSITSLAACIAWSPQLASTGLCGLSGIAHGLAVFVSLHWIHRAHGKRAKGTTTWRSYLPGTLLFVCLIVKSAYELFTTQIFFGSIHPGYLGTPLVHSHIGGVLGGVLAMMLWHSKHFFSKTKDYRKQPVTHQSTERKDDVNII
ncbi:MAG: rhomboid family intramembrane serine protease [Desulfobacterales bacterium]|nr:rhomboid family intramembrane serine protease [Deltaproteobacteria bacterium]NNK97167.1 rhomboid family intramembrane serine protease [Desulfobacterales bacterium]